MFKRSLISVTTQAIIYSSFAMPIAVSAEEENVEATKGLERITVTSQKRLQSI